MGFNYISKLEELKDYDIIGAISNIVNNKEVKNNFMTLEDTIEKRGLIKGRKEGRKKGRKEGYTKGEVDGEYKKAIKTAKQMKKDNMSIEAIIKYTGLSKEEIEKL